MEQTTPKAPRLELVKLDAIIPDPANARRHNERNIKEIMRSLGEFRQHAPLVVQRSTNRILVGNGRYEAMKRLGWTDTLVQFVDDDNITAVRRSLADNRTAELAEWDDEVLARLMEEVGCDIPGWTDEEREDIISSAKALLGRLDDEQEDEKSRSLAERFGIAPFSVLNAREGWWQGRKKAWINLGIQSEIGRGGDGSDKKSGGLLFKSRTIADTAFYDKKQAKEKELGRKLSTEEYTTNYYDPPPATGFLSGTSIFDPVLCELIYRWFSRYSDTVLDPFAGGSVRGIVASRLGRAYTGIDLREEQVEANRGQAHLSSSTPPQWITGNSLNIPDLIGPIQADLLFSCPPYADLEVYSDLTEDLSNMPYGEFMRAYREIIRLGCSALKDNRFACFVVGEVRDKQGNYYGFVPDTIKAFQDAGLKLYNEAILVTCVGSGALRASHQFDGSRKLVKTHQNVLVFSKGDAKKAIKRLGACEFGEIPEGEDYEG